MAALEESLAAVKAEESSSKKPAAKKSPGQEDLLEADREARPRQASRGRGPRALAHQPRQGPVAGAPRRQGRLEAGVHQGRGDRLLRPRRRHDPPPPARPAADPGPLPRRGRGPALLREAGAQATRPTGSTPRRSRWARSACSTSSSATTCRRWSGSPSSPRSSCTRRCRSRRSPSARPCSPSTSTRASRRPRSSARRSRCALRDAVREPRARVLRQALRLEGDPGLRAAEHGGHLRADEVVRARRRPGDGEVRARARGLEAGPQAAQGQGARRLEPERLLEDDGRRLLAALPAAPLGLDAADLGRGRGARRRRRSRTRSASRRRGARADRRARRPLRPGPRAEAEAAEAR